MSCRILIRIDAHSDIGLAHIVRVRGLIDALGMPTQLSIWGESSIFGNYFGDAPVFKTENNLLGGIDALKGQLKPDILLVDHPHLTPDDWKRLYASFDCPIVAIDDFGGEILADLIINGTVLPEYHHYPSLPENGKVLCGADYALINNIFRENSWVGDVNKQSLCVVVGGGDRATQWAWELSAPGGPLAFIKDVNFIVGQSYSAFDLLKTRCGASGINVFQGLGQAELCEILSSTTGALVTGGMIVYEVLAMGVPAIVFPQIDNLIAEMNWFEKQDAVINLGYKGGMDMAIVETSLDNFLSDYDELRAFSLTARNVIDGYGMCRSAKALRKLIEEKCVL